MRTALDIQTGGSIVVLGCFAVSEASAGLLDRYPGSAFVWYLNVGLFRIFETARAETSPLNALFSPWALELALVGLGLAIVFRMMRFRFGVALLANISFLAAMALARCAHMGGAWASRTASSDAIVPELALLTLLLGSSSAAFLACHVSFLSQIERRRGSTATP